VPYQEAPGPPVDDALRAAAAKALHVVREDGSQIWRGSRAVLLVNSEVGGLPWRLLAALFWHPPLKWLADLGYAILANNRSFFARFLYRSK